MAARQVEQEIQTGPEGMDIENSGRKRSREEAGENSEVSPEESASDIKRKPAPQDLVDGKSTEGGENESPIDKELSLQDLMQAINGVGAEVADLKGEFRGAQGKLVEDVHLLTERVSKSEGAAASVSDAVRENADNIEELRRELHRFRQSGELSTLSSFGRNEARNMRLQIERLEGYSRRYNLIIVGLAETENESDEALSAKVYSFMANLLGVSTVQFDICHRLGPKNGRAERRVIVKFTSLKDKNFVWEARSAIKNSRLYTMFQDKPKSVKEREALAFKILRAAQISGQYRTCKFQSGKLWFNGICYEFEDFESLPEVLRPAYVSSPRNSTHIAFFSRFSPLSNHFASTFSLRGMVFVNMEQYLARSRAIFAKNQKIADRVMLLNEPTDHKRFLEGMKEDGRTPAWQAAINSWLLPGLEAKFAQNEMAREFLLGTKGLTIGEASTNLFWGIGLDLRDHNLFNPAHWTGRNVLGEALMQVRQVLLDNH